VKKIGIMEYWRDGFFGSQYPNTPELHYSN